MDPSAAKPLAEEDAPRWDGFARRRWANLYALLFALTIGPSVALTCDAIDISRNGRGQDVANLLVGIFVLVGVMAGLFLAKLLAWRLGERGRTIAMIVTLAVGTASLVGAWQLWRTW